MYVISSGFKIIQPPAGGIIKKLFSRTIARAFFARPLAFKFPAKHAKTRRRTYCYSKWRASYHNKAVRRVREQVDNGLSAARTCYSPARLFLPRCAGESMLNSPSSWGDAFVTSGSRGISKQPWKRRRDVARETARSAWYSYHDSLNELFSSKRTLPIVIPLPRRTPVSVFRNGGDFVRFNCRNSVSRCRSDGMRFYGKRVGISFCSFSRPAKERRLFLFSFLFRFLFLFLFSLFCFRGGSIGVFMRCSVPCLVLWGEKKKKEKRKEKIRTMKYGHRRE